LLEPLRLEADAPLVSQVLLPWSYGKVLWLHCLLPLVIMTVLGVVAIAGGWAAGLVEVSVVPGAFVLLIPEVAVMVLAAALSARRGGGIPSSILTLTGGDPVGGGFLIVILWAVGWALLAIAAVALGVHALGSSAALSGAVTSAVGLSTLAIVLRRVLVASKR
ncbi:MAG TPA: hypothetical protein VFE20_07425, partial [Thermoleophilia bacterium]|nr:hypothetical protein [Thermoleophilia bacterium]